MANTSRSQREAARRARVEQLQREQQAKERRRTLTVIGVLAVVIVAVIVAVSWALVSRGSPASATQIIPSTPSGSATVQTPLKNVPNPTDITGVKAWDTQGYPAPGEATLDTIKHDHVLGPVTYSVVPPVGGPHSEIWMNAGVYTEPIPAERAIHNLEHGAVWITYRPSLPAAQVQALTDFVGTQTLIDEQTGIAGQANRYIDMSPWSDNKLPSPIVISSWGYQLRVTSPTDPRLQQFVDTFRNSKTYSPEYGGAVDGVPVQTGGRADSNGGTKANPPGAAQGQ